MTLRSRVRAAVSEVVGGSAQNSSSIDDLVSARCAATGSGLTDPLSAPPPRDWPAVDISAVTFDSEQHLETFGESLLALEYPKDKLSVRFVDHGSSDGTVAALESLVGLLRESGAAAEVLRQANRGFGGGHNAAIAGGRAPFALVTNVDLTFEPNALGEVVRVACADHLSTAAWELRQKPYEHPKYYDPVTGLTNWNAHACVLLRREAFERAGGYDETIFMYGEDVELSYRLRRAGAALRYVPRAVVWHHTYARAGELKPRQYTGSLFANLYLRFKYGSPIDQLAAVPLAASVWAQPPPFKGARRAVARELSRLARAAPAAWRSREPSAAHFPFRAFDYELTRDGAFVEQQPLPGLPPLVSVITRTHKDRALYLRQAQLSVAHQTWPNVEHVVVQDGGDSARETVDEVARATGHAVRFFRARGSGRAAAGNTGLEEAQGRYCLFLDDDDLVFADHVESLVLALLADPGAAAAYSLAWEVATDASGVESGTYRELSHRVPPVLRQDFDFQVLRHHNYLPIQSVLFQRRLFEDRGGFDLGVDTLEDWLLWTRFAWRNRFVHVPRLTSMFRVPASKEQARARQHSLDVAYANAVRTADAQLAALAQRHP
jgi:GT2 family glycosyltransferase